jgi:DNA-directed RNA polymerase omega subunit
MPVKAFPFEKLEEKIINVYEAVIVAARRARQINDEQMIQVRTLMDGEDVEEDDNGRINREDILDIEKLPKPVATALQEMLDHKIEYEYLVKEEK